MPDKWLSTLDCCRNNQKQFSINLNKTQNRISKAESMKLVSKKNKYVECILSIELPKKKKYKPKVFIEFSTADSEFPKMHSI